MTKNVHQKSTEYIKDNFSENELSNFYVRDFVNDGRDKEFAMIKSNPKTANFVKHTKKLSEMTALELLNYTVSDFSFFVGLDDYVNFKQKITEKQFPILFVFDDDYADAMYNLAKNDLVIRDVNTNGIFFAIEFFENTKQIKRVFTLYPVSIEIKENNILELKFSVQNESNNQSLLTLILELNQLVADKRSVINISNEDLSNITLN